MDVAIHLARPSQKAPEIAPLTPHEFPKFKKADLCHLHAGKSFDPPQKIWAPPRGETVAFCGIPQKAQFVAHGSIILGRQRSCTRIWPLGSVPQLNCHSEQAFFALRGTWASRAKHRGFCDAIVARLARFLFHHARIHSPLDFSCMDADARQIAEDHYYAALDLMAEGHLEQAVEAYRQSLAADPTFTEPMHGLVRALQDLQRYDEAIEVAQRIAKIDPDDVLAHTSLSVLYQKKGMIAEAEAEGAKARVLGWKQQLKKG
jgi:hypothetical protein